MSAREHAGSPAEAAARYDDAARHAAATVIRRYSTSFGLACRLLGPEVRPHVYAVYALVRIADEIVDGASAGAGVPAEGARELLDDLEAETYAAIDRGFSSNLVVHAFARTARLAGIGAELVRPFFASMRADLAEHRHSADSLDAYVYGSAEVVGLMCLRVFLAGHPVDDRRRAGLEAGARRLGAAFQKVNFLRDLAQDFGELGRVYFPGVEPHEFSEADKRRLLDDIDADLAAARAVVGELPVSSRAAVLTAHDLFRELAARIRATPARQLLDSRVRVPNPRKAALAAAAVARARPRRRAAAPGERRAAAPRGRRAVVVGAGIAGLAAAGLLARDGWDVEVLERGATTGGRAGLLERDGFRFDTGPSWYLMPEVFDHFFRLMGSSAARELELVPLDPAYRVWGENYPEPLDIRSDLEHTVALFESVEPGAGARIRAYLASAERTYALAVDHFLYTSYTSFAPLLTRAVVRGLPGLVRHLTGSLHGFAARTVQDTRLRQVLGYPAVFLASAPRMTPSLYHLMSHMDLADSVQYPRGGFHRIVEAAERLAVAHGARIRTEADVVRITTSRASAGPARATGVVWRDGEGAEHELAADVVVSAADLHHTETRLLPPALQTYPQRWWDRRQSGPGAVLVMLGVRGALPELPHHSLFFTEDWDANFRAIFVEPTSVPDPASVYVCKPSATDPTVAPAGHENLFVLVPVPADPGLGAGGPDGTGAPAVEAVADRVLDQIAAWAGIPDLRERIVLRHTVGPEDFRRDLNSWRGNVLGPAHVLRQSAFFRGSTRSRRVAGLHYCGASTLPGIGLPMCLISAEILLKDLRGDTSTGPLAEPPVPGA
ncbi:phytoene desaturase family protein [Kocuria sp. M1R5S2]|uniref:phytoene desaturase family protein n=1 Tax=Kocuria rhizosphaerae TaxID=3376285 RepID=UPI0037A9DB6C